MRTNFASNKSRNNSNTDANAFDRTFASAMYKNIDCSPTLCDLIR